MNYMHVEQLRLNKNNHYLRRKGGIETWNNIFNAESFMHSQESCTSKTEEK